MFNIPKNASASVRRVPIYLQKPDGSGQSSTSGVTVVYRKPNSGSDTDVTSGLTADGGDGRFYVELSSGQVDTAGTGWIKWSGASILTDVDYIQINDDAERNADQVWDELASGHAVAGSFSEILGVLLGVLHVNARLDNTVYGANAVLTSARLRVFASKAAADSSTDGAGNNAEGEIYRFTVSAVDAGSGQIDTYKMVRDL